MDPVSLVVGAGLLIAGFLSGRFSRRRGAGGTNGPKQLSAICGCKHGLEQHDPETKACHGRTLQRNVYSKEGKWLGTQWIDCTCRRYVGPVPAEEILGTPYIPPAID